MSHWYSVVFLYGGGCTKAEALVVQFVCGWYCMTRCVSGWWFVRGDTRLCRIERVCNFGRCSSVQLSIVCGTRFNEAIVPGAIMLIMLMLAWYDIQLHLSIGSVNDAI
mgnify:CR=1 FL=1